MNFTQMEDYNNDPKVLEKFGRNIVDEVKKGKIDTLSSVEKMKSDVS